VPKIAVVTYIEEVKPGWREFDRAIHDNLGYTFEIDSHYYVARTSADRDWFHKSKPGVGEKHCVSSVKEARKHLGEAWLYVNVQPPHFFEERDLWLQDYDHTRYDTCYIFGPNHGPVELTSGAHISIPLDKSSLYASSAVAMVLYDRQIKLVP